MPVSLSSMLFVERLRLTSFTKSRYPACRSYQQTSNTSKMRQSRNSTRWSSTHYSIPYSGTAQKATVGWARFYPDRSSQCHPCRLVRGTAIPLRITRSLEPSEYRSGITSQEEFARRSTNQQFGKREGPSKATTERQRCGAEREGQAARGRLFWYLYRLSNHARVGEGKWLTWIMCISAGFPRWTGNTKSSAEYGWRTINTTKEREPRLGWSLDGQDGSRSRGYERCIKIFLTSRNTRAGERARLLEWIGA